MGGNKIVGLSTDVVDDGDAVSFGNVENVSSGKVNKTGGDYMSGDLTIGMGTDTTRQMGCENLGPGESFRINLGDSSNNMEHTSEMPIILSASNGSVIKFANNNVVNFFSDSIELGTRLELLGTDPIGDSDVCKKEYVDSINLLREAKCYIGYIPYLSSNENKNGIMLSDSGHIVDHDPYKAFNPLDNSHSWIPNSPNDCWIKVQLSESIKIWKFVIRGIVQNEGFFNWELRGSNDDMTWTTIHTETAYTVDDRILHSFTLDVSSSFRYYTLYCYTSTYTIEGNVGLKIFQIYTHNVR